MNFTKLVSMVAGLGVLFGAAFAIDGRYLRVEAAEKAQEQQTKSVNELRQELYLQRVAVINAKPKPSKDELDEKDRLMALVKAIEAEKVKK